MAERDVGGSEFEEEDLRQRGFSRRVLTPSAKSSSRRWRRARQLLPGSEQPWRPGSPPATGPDGLRSGRRFHGAPKPPALGRWPAEVFGAIEIATYQEGISSRNGTLGSAANCASSEQFTTASRNPGAQPAWGRIRSTSPFDAVLNVVLLWCKIRSNNPNI